MDTRLELEYTFKDYIYNDTDHSYKYKPTNKSLKSVTQFLKSISPAFNTEFWSVLKAFEYSGYTISNRNESKNMFTINGNNKIIIGETNIDDFNLSFPVKRVLKEWKEKNSIGKNRGTYLHNLLEQLDRRNFTKRDFRIDCDEITLGVIKAEKQFNSITWDSVENTFNIMELLAHRFKKECDFIIPIACEYIVGDVNIGLAGTFDRLYYNESSGDYEIWDFKNDKQLRYSDKYNKFELFGLDACEFEKYSLQTSLYKMIIQDNTSIKLGESYIVHFNWKTNSYEIIKTNDYTNLIKQEINGNNNWTAYI
jgi:hypothetical protein